MNNLGAVKTLTIMDGPLPPQKDQEAEHAVYSRLWNQISTEMFKREEHQRAAMYHEAASEL